MRIIDVLRRTHEAHLAERPGELAPVPEKNVDDSSPKAEVVAHLRDRVGGRVSRETDRIQLAGVERVLRRENGGLVVRPALVVEERLRHPKDISTVENVIVVTRR